MTASDTNESGGKGNVDYSEDVERDSAAKTVDVANMERVEVTEEDVRSHRSGGWLRSSLTVAFHRTRESAERQTK